MVNIASRDEDAGFDMVIVGAGVGGLYMLHRLHRLSLRSMPSACLTILAAASSRRNRGRCRRVPAARDALPIDPARRATCRARRPQPAPSPSADTPR
ncbi:hypothetical protein C5615_26445 [Burkholderia cepacia]|uniref:Uncharacterized protein n=1 Tax=Burkholderia cepacia TaxID=292 RepID=A0A2S8II61_BURCE|nr:hypothetical protein C5615_26445 [Burkholderia cepacia]